jgi:hypothetical protein
MWLGMVHVSCGLFVCECLCRIQNLLKTEWCKLTSNLLYYRHGVTYMWHPEQMRHMHGEPIDLDGIELWCLGTLVCKSLGFSEEARFDCLKSCYWKSDVCIN